MKNELEVSDLGLSIMIDLNKEHRTIYVRKIVPKLSINEFVDAKYEKFKK